MKNFRSSKNLRISELPKKEQPGLRAKIKMLQEQIQLLQKSNLNILIPLSEHDSKPETNYEAIINKLKKQVLGLQQEVQRCKTAVKKLESEKEMLKFNYQRQLEGLRDDLEQLKQEKKELENEVELANEDRDSQKAKRQEKEKQNIQMRVENKFLKEDMQQQKKRTELAEKKYNELNGCVLSVHSNSKIYKSRETQITAIETLELKRLKGYIDELEAKLNDIMAANRQERITLGVPKKNIGEEIVRLKKNIDLQLGLPASQKTTKSFLQVYNQTNLRFDELITNCKK